MARNSQMEVSNNVSGVRRSARLAAKNGVESPAVVDKQYRRKQANPKKYVAPTEMYCNRHCDTNVSDRGCNNCDAKVSDVDVNLFLNFLNNVAAAANASARNPIVAEPPAAPRRSTRGRVVEEDGTNSLRITVNVEEKPEGGLRRSTRSTRNKNRYVFDEEDAGAMDDNDSLYEPNEDEERDDDFEMDDLVDENEIVESEVEEPEEEVEAPARKRRNGGRASGYVNVSKPLCSVLGFDSRKSYNKDFVRKALFDYIETKNLYTSKTGIIVKLNNDLKTVYKHDEPNDLVVVYKVVNSILKHQTTPVNRNANNNEAATKYAEYKAAATVRYYEAKAAEKIATKVAKAIEPIKNIPVTENTAVNVSKPLQKLLGKGVWANKESVRDALFAYMKDNNLYTKQKDTVKINDALRTVYDHEETKAVVYKVVNSILKHHVSGREETKNVEGRTRNIQSWMSFLNDIRSRTSALVGQNLNVYGANVIAREIYCKGFDESSKVSDDLLKATYKEISNGYLRKAIIA